MKLSTPIIFVAVAVLSTVSAAAQDVATPLQSAVPPTVPAPVCELRVFPTIEGRAQTTSMLSSFGLIGGLADAAANKDRNVSEAQYLQEALGPRLQVEALKRIDLVQALRLEPSRVIFEAPITDRSISTKAETRLTSSTATCYVELIVTQNFYTKHPIYGRSLNNRYVLKDFRGGKTKTKLIKGRGGNGLVHFPPKTPNETEAAEQELRDVFSKNFLEYAASITRSAK